MPTFDKRAKAVGREIKQVDQSVMDGLKRYLDKEIAITTTFLPLASTLTAKYTLKGIMDFRHLTVIADETHDIQRIEFIHVPDEDLSKTRVITNIFAIENEKTVNLFTNRLFVEDDGTVNYDEMKRMLRLGKDMLRKLTFGSEIAEMLSQGDLAYQAILRK